VIYEASSEAKNAAAAAMSSVVPDLFNSVFNSISSSCHYTHHESKIRKQPINKYPRFIVYLTFSTLTAAQV
jgi:hypothetical protein